MKDRRDYDQAFALVRSAIHAWDPYQLIAEGSPLDEFDHEIAKIVARIPRCRSERDLATAISEVFSESFAPDRFPVDDCSKPARLALHGLVGARLWPTA